jgi:hypothetical protein
MDMDSEVNACLDIIAEFSTQINEDNNTAFTVKYMETPTDNEVKIISQQLRQWVKLNEFDKRMFKIFRNTIKYGDQIFIRDPETFKLYWVATNKITRVIVNESEGKVPEQYIVQDINPNLENLTVAAKTTSDFSVQPPGGGYTAPQTYTIPNMPDGSHGRFSAGPREVAVDAHHVIHISLTEGMDYNWPFGVSILEQIFKVYKQKELLEDAIIIYRIQRAPERRVFSIDVGSMPAHLAMGFVERIKNEIHQRRIPSQSGGQNMMDASYNTMCIDLTTKIPLLDGRTLELNEIVNEYADGKENWIYSCDPVTGAMAPGKVAWAGETRKNAEVIKLHLDNGETLIVTLDHKIPVLGKGFVEAQDLTVDQSLIAFNTQTKPVTNEQVSNHKITKIEYLPDTMNTGCLTVDNDWHTFATSAGIFIKNSMNEDYFFPTTADGRGSKVETLPGGQNLSEIDDLRYFNNKMARGLRVPSSYLPTGPEDSQSTVNDGRMGTALIQEHRFNQYCERMQNGIVTQLNDEFKMFLRWRGFNIDAKIFDLQFNTPQNFASYRQTELDSARLNNFGAVSDISHMSKRFALKRFLGLSEEEMLENERMWREENNVNVDSSVTGSDLRGVGITPGGFDKDIGDMGDFDAAADGADGDVAEVGSGSSATDVDVELP